MSILPLKDKHPGQYKSTQFILKFLIDKKTENDRDALHAQCHLIKYRCAIISQRQGSEMRGWNRADRCQRQTGLARIPPSVR